MAAEEQCVAMQDSIDRQVEQAKNDNTIMSNIAKASVAQKLAEKYGVTDILQSGSSANLTEEQQRAYSAYQTDYSAAIARIEAQSAMNLKQIEAKREQMIRLQLEPLKQEQKLLSTQKERMESRLKMYTQINQNYANAKGNELKDLIPNPGGGGNG